MSEFSSHIYKAAERVGEPDGRWRCSACGGSVRGNAPRCKHCYALFGPPEPESSSSDPSHSQARPQQQKVALLMVAVFFGVGYGGIRVGSEIGGYLGIMVGWLSATAVAGLFLAAIMQLFDENEPITVTKRLKLWIVITLMALPMIAGNIVLYPPTPWWRIPLGSAVIVIMFGVLTYVVSRISWLQAEATSTSTAEQQYKKGSEIRTWINLLMWSVIPVTIISWIANRWNLPYLYSLLPLLIIRSYVIEWFKRRVECIRRR